MLVSLDKFYMYSCYTILLKKLILDLLSNLICLGGPHRQVGKDANL